MDEDRPTDRFDESDTRAPDAVPPTIPVSGEREPPSSFTDDPFTRLWQSAEGRESGAEAVEQIRARRQPLGAETGKKPG